jgi:hypothetical protein
MTSMILWWYNHYRKHVAWGTFGDDVRDSAKKLPLSRQGRGTYSDDLVVSQKTLVPLLRRHGKSTFTYDVRNWHKAVPHARHDRDSRETLLFGRQGKARLGRVAYRNVVRDSHETVEFLGRGRNIFRDDVRDSFKALVLRRQGRRIFIGDVWDSPGTLSLRRQCTGTFRYDVRDSHETLQLWRQRTDTFIDDVRDSSEIVKLGRKDRVIFSYDVRDSPKTRYVYSYRWRAWFTEENRSWKARQRYVCVWCTRPYYFLDKAPVTCVVHIRHDQFEDKAGVHLWVTYHINATQYHLDKKARVHSAMKY